METILLVLGFSAVGFLLCRLLRRLGLFLEGGNLRPYWDAGEEAARLGEARRE